MKKSYTFLLAILTLVFLNIHQIQAQNYVTIPDANFRTALKFRFPSCFNNLDQIDTQCSGVMNATTLKVPYSQILNLEGIQYFVKLQYLDCSFNHSIFIPTLPATLIELNCDSSRLTSLPTLPSNLSILSCNTNRLTTLPNLPASLTQLDCGFNFLTSLPTLPAGLTNLYAWYNCFTTIPSNPNPTTLKKFFVEPNSPYCSTITASEAITNTTTLSLYPNPTEDKVSLSYIGEITKLELYNSYGQIIPVTLDKSTHEFSMEGLPSGIYTLSLLADGKPVTLKIAKK